MSRAWIWTIRFALLLCMRPDDTSGADGSPVVDASFEYRSVTQADRAIVYRLYAPPCAAHARELPLLLWFHGRGESGDDQRRQLAWLELILQDGARNVEFPALIVAPQFPRGAPPWVARPSGNEEDSGRSDPLRDVDRIVADVQSRYRVDTRRMSLAGISQGATAAWEYARRHPGRFAGLLSLAATDTRNLTAPATHDCPSQTTPPPAVWAFQSTADGPRLQAHITARIAELRRAGRPAHATMVDSRDHDCWTAALRDHRAHRWLIRQQLPAVADDAIDWWRTTIAPLRILATAAVMGLAARDARRRAAARSRSRPAGDLNR